MDIEYGEILGSFLKRLNEYDTTTAIEETKKALTDLEEQLKPLNNKKK